MGTITGGNVVHGGKVIEDSKPNVIYVEAVPTDANVGGGYWTPDNGQLACDIRNGDMYERQAAVWTRVDTLVSVAVGQAREVDVAYPIS